MANFIFWLICDILFYFTFVNIIVKQVAKKEGVSKAEIWTRIYHKIGDLVKKLTKLISTATDKIKSSIKTPEND